MFRDRMARTHGNTTETYPHGLFPSVVSLETY